MKLTLAILTAMVAFATVNCQSLKGSEGPLYEDIQYFLDMIPMDEVMDLAMTYVVEDAEFQKALEYVISDDFQQLFKEIEAIPEFRVFLDYLESEGVRVYDQLNVIHDILNIEPLQPLAAAKKQITGGIGGFFTDVMELVKYADFIHGYAYKMRTSEAFRHFVEHLQSPNHQQFINTLYSNERFLKVRSNLINGGFDVMLIEDTLFIVVGIEFPVTVMRTYSDNQLSKDIHEFLDLAFTDEVMDTLVRYIVTDPEVQAALEYAYSPEFHQMVRDVEALKEYQDLVLYFVDSGLDIIGSIQKFHELVGMEDYVPPKPVNGKYRSMNSVSNQAGGGIKRMVEEVKALLPMKELKALFEKKMETSKPFADLIAHLSTPEVQKIVNSLYTHEVYLEMRQKALEAGLDLDELNKLFLAIFGIEFPEV